MRFAKWMFGPALGAAALMTACGPGYRTGVGVYAQPGAGIDLYGYDAGRYGDWHANYRSWTPASVYELNGTYYPNRQQGAREVQVYRTPSGYVLPPRDAEWSKTETRFDKKKVPTEADYGRAKAHP